jgi:DHA1 family bicyclomycin/chloramphenicol resistance-like MFS transporter
VTLPLPQSGNTPVLTPARATFLVAGLSMLQPLSTDLYLPTLPGIASAFNASTAEVQWTLSAFIAAFGLWQLVAGPLSDRYGRRPAILAGALTFLVASLLCMTAPSVTALIVGRVLQAIGACTCLVGTRGMVRDLYTPIDGARLLAGAATFMSLAPLIGPLVGAVLFESFGWRSAFAALAAFAVLVLLACTTLLKETRHGHDRTLAPGPIFATYLAVAGSHSFRAYTLTATASYAGLFAFLSGSSFVLIRVLGLSATQFALSFSVMVAGYLVGTLACRRLVNRGLQHAIQAGALVQLAAGTALAAAALAGWHIAEAIVVPMFVFGVSHGLIQSPAQSGAVAPFRHAAGAAAALLGFLMMTCAAAIGVWIGVSYNGTVYPLTLTIAACSAVTALVAFTLVRRHGDVSHHD